MKIKIKDFTGDFAENKEVSRKLRIEKILPTLEKNEELVLDFFGVSAATQSFVHSLISEAIRRYNDRVFDLLVFENCSDAIKNVVTIVYEYMQESLEDI